MDYIPYDTLIKQEHTDVDDRQVIGYLIAQPGMIVKVIKQELLDNTVKDISECHKTSCEVNKYVQEHSGVTGLKIEDVCSLIQADQMVTPEKPKRIVHMAVRGCRQASDRCQACETSTNPALSVVTIAPPSTLVKDNIPDIPLHVVTTTAAGNPVQPLNVVTNTVPDTSESLSSLNVVTTSPSH